MSKKKLLSEAQVKRFMGLAGLSPLNEMYHEKEEGMREEEELDEMRGQMKRDEMREEEAPMPPMADEEPAEEMEADAADVEMDEEDLADVKSALDTLQSKLAPLLDQAEGEEPDMEEPADEPEMEMDAEEEPEMDETFVREYTEKAPAAVTSEPSSVNKHSTVASKNDMGGKAASSSGGENSGSKAATAKVHDAGNVNKPGAKVKPVAAPKPKATA